MNPFDPCLFVLSADAPAETRECALRVAATLRESGTTELFGVVTAPEDGETAQNLGLPALHLWPAKEPRAGLKTQLTTSALFALRPRAVVGDRKSLAAVAAMLEGAARLKTAILIAPDSATRADRKLLAAFAHSAVVRDSLSTEEIAKQLG